MQLKKITELTEDEIRYIANQIHISGIRMLFQKNSRSFAKIKPGFRPNKLSDADTLSLAVKNINEHFISSFFDKIISDWLDEINENCEKLVEEGCSEGEALLKTIPDSIFHDNCDLYFKLIENENDEYIKLFKNAMAMVNKIDKNDEHNKSVSDDSTTEQLNAANEKIATLESELEQEVKSVEELSKTLHDKEEQLDKITLEAHNTSEQLHTVQVLKL